MTRLIATCGVLLSISMPVQSTLQAQATLAGQVRTRYDVVSIKPNGSGSRSVSIRNRGWHFVGQNISVMSLIVSAYKVAPQHVLNAPDWLRSEKFDVEAKIVDADPASVPIDRVALMRNLLTDRFAAVIRETSTNSRGYALVIANPDRRFGPRLKPSLSDCAGPVAQVDSPCRISSDTGVIRGTGVPLAQLATFLSQRTNLIITNQTELEGLFDFVLEWAPDDPSPRPAEIAQLPVLAGADLFTAVREQLGLRLAPEDAELGGIYIDRIQRPTAN